VNIDLDVVLIRGAPGAGKSTLGRRLRAALTAAAVVEVDDLRTMLSQVDWANRRHHDQALAGMFALARGLLGAGVRPVVVIDTLSRSRMLHVHTWLEGEGYRHHTVSLWVEPSQLRARLEQRESGFREWEPSAVLNDEVLATRWPQETLLDAGALGRDELADRVLRCLADLRAPEEVAS